jgi:hypothetical protein
MCAAERALSAVWSVVVDIYGLFNAYDTPTGGVSDRIHRSFSGRKNHQLFHLDGRVCERRGYGGWDCCGDGHSVGSHLYTRFRCRRSHGWN